MIYLFMEQTAEDYEMEFIMRVVYLINELQTEQKIFLGLLTEILMKFWRSRHRTSYSRKITNTDGAIAGTFNQS